MKPPPLLPKLLSYPRAPLEGGGHLPPGIVAREGLKQFFDVGDADRYGAPEEFGVHPIGFFPLEGSGNDIEQILVSRLHQLLPLRKNRGVIPPLEALDGLIRLVT